MGNESGMNELELDEKRQKQQDKLKRLSEAGFKTFEQPYTRENGTEGRLVFNYDRKRINRLNLLVQNLQGDSDSFDAEMVARSILTEAISEDQAQELGDLLTEPDNTTLAVNMSIMHAGELVISKVSLGKPKRV